MNSFFKTMLACLLAIVISSFLGFLFILVTIVSMVAALSSSATYTMPKTSVLKVDLSVPIVERKTSDVMAQFDLQHLKIAKTITLIEATSLIRGAAHDPAVSMLVLDVPMALPMQSTAIYEMRRAVEDFRAASGKKVVAYSDHYSQGGYYLASAADEVYLNPMGGLQWWGMASQVSFFRGTLNKLGVEPEVFRCGKFKGAIEPFLLDKLSPENRAQLDDVLTSMWGFYVGDVARARNIDSTTLQTMASTLGITSPAVAKSAGLVNDLYYRDQLSERIEKITDEKDPHIVTLDQYALAKGPYQGPAPLSDHQIAVVYADGDIVDQGEQNQIVGNDMAKQLAELRKNDNVKAVVLRVNSPGGSALASDIIHHEMGLLKAAKPVVVSMGSYAASGGYYISCNADRIVANPTTITGSIGVFGLMFNAQKGAEKLLGMTFDQVKTNDNADMFNLFRPMTPAQKMYMQAGVDTIYHRFTGLVAQGRNLPQAKVDSLAQGRIYSGIGARALGLVDQWGTLDDAIRLAAELAAVGEDFYLGQYPSTDNSFLGMMMQMAETTVHALVPGVAERRMVERMVNMQGIRTQMEYDLQVE